jgi:hypothetical protein
MIRNMKLNGIVTKYTNKYKKFSFKKNNFSISEKPNITLNELNSEENIYHFHKKFYGLFPHCVLYCNLNENAGKGGLG